MGRHARGRLVDYYAALGVSEQALFREIEAAYWREALRNREGLPLLNEAYEVLGHTERRAEYDAQRAAAAAQPPMPRSKAPAAVPRRPSLHEFLG